MFLLLFEKNMFFEIFQKLKKLDITASFFIRLLLMKFYEDMRDLYYFGFRNVQKSEYYLQKELTIKG